ncbi:N-6 DNA methylase [Haloarcula amylovorans]|uniref:N-6 DNA methylase n=1 Tax=Haloarcula amylovorans TaxID=2562280 RepID=UPI00107676FF|nr:N-6 DNA methylase [Halomicroarcula amylolytica]
MSSPQIECDGIVAMLDQIRQRGHSDHTVFEDWVDLMLYALQRRDDPYRDIVDRYRDRADMDQPDGQRSGDLFSKAFGQLQDRMAATDADVLGSVYEEYGMGSDAFGQHFTLHSVCEMLVELTDVVDESRDNQRPTITDPACGSGRMLLMAGRKQPEALFVGQDKDPLCAKMTALNCCFFNLDAYVIQGDSLTVEYQRAWRTSFSSLGGTVRELDEDEVAALRDAMTGAEETPPRSDTDDAAGQSESSPSIPPSTLPDGEQASLLAFDGDR